jgi:ribonuclease HI
MELQAAIEGFKALKQPCRVLLVSDSEYLINGLTKWIHGWKANEWSRSKKKFKPVAKH